MTWPRLFPEESRRGFAVEPVRRRGRDGDMEEEHRVDCLYCRASWNVPDAKEAVRSGREHVTAFHLPKPGSLLPGFGE